jgi:MoaA/NifB/PqqE/SkfB family radical SAM enzyme
MINKNRLEIDLTLRCNLSCANCDRMAPKSIDLSLDDLSRCINAGRNWEKIRLVGGEPILHPHIETVIDILSFYKNRCFIEFTTNGLNEEKIKSLPAWFHVVNSRKDSLKLGENPFFKTFNVAPCDLPEYKDAVYSKGCCIAEICGVCFSVDGLYYPCGAGATVAREFNMKIGQYQVETVWSWMFEKLCRLCGHFKYKDLCSSEGRTQKQEQSKSWKSRIFRK